jgi:pimeloyl-ACP methyl ester carboxylesterase
MRARRAFLPVIALVLVALPSPAASAAGPTKPCRDDRSARCGSVLVPLYRGAPDGGGRKLRVRFRVFPRTDRSKPALEPVVGAEGGPGYPSIDSAESYLFMLGPLRRRRDLIVMDNRGTGQSGAINCPRLQAGLGVYSREVGRCAKRLGRRANAYGTGAAADDLAAVLDKLGVPVVNIYGDSYGTYFAQAFAVRHPERVRAVVLDAAFGVEGFDPWIREESIGVRHAWPAVCERSAGCNQNALATLRRWALRLERRPLVATGRDADGGRHRIRLDGAALGQMAGDGSFYYTIYRDLLAALRAYGRGDRAPLLRLAAEDLPYTGGGPVRGYSEGAYAAVACHDYPTLWDPAAPIPQRRAQYRAARALLEPDAYAPFPNDIWLRSLYINQYVTGCIEWPTPRHPDPPVPLGAAYPTMPVLVLDGDLDVITPLGDSAQAASLFPGSTFVIVRNVGHVTALADYPGCGAGMVRRFLQTLSPGDVSCAERTPEIHVVPEFPRRTRAAPPAERRPGAGDRSTPMARRGAWGASWAVGDAIARWWLMAGVNGHGLRGGSFTTTGAYLAYTPVRFKLRRVRFVPDLAVSGTVEWNRREGRVTARLRLSGAVRGRLRLRWRMSDTRAEAFMSGRLDGRPVRLRMPAP